MKNKSKNKIKLIQKNSPYFPKSLTALQDCPDILFVLGNENILNSFSISIVGTRNSSKDGNTIAYNFARELASNNIIIISGLASGIDSNAHLGTLNIGKTIAIIACGFDYISNSKQKLVNDIINSGGAIISEYFPDTPPQKFTFLKRNRLIAAMSYSVIVVEAPENSGALNTAQTAINLNKTIFSIPWNINSLNGVGCNNLILQGAKILTNSKQVLKHFNITNISIQLSNNTSENKLTKNKISENFINLYNFISKNQPVLKETIYSSYFEDISTINSKLILMELENLITLNRRQILYLSHLKTDRTS